MYVCMYVCMYVRDSVNFQTNSGSSYRSMPLARKCLLSDLLANLLALRISSASIKLSSMLNLSVLQALSPSFYSLLSLLSSLPPSSFPAYSPLPSVIRPSAPCSTSAIAFRLRSLEDKGRLSPPLSLQIGVFFAAYHGNIPFHLPLCVGGPACITGTPFNYLPT